MIMLLMAVAADVYKGKKRMNVQLLVCLIHIMIIQVCIFLIYPIFYFRLSYKINKIEDTLRQHTENENKLYNRLLIDKIKSKTY